MSVTFFCTAIYIILFTISTISSSSGNELNNKTCSWNVQNGAGDDVIFSLSELSKLETPIECDLFYGNDSDSWLEYTPCQNSAPCINIDNNLNKSYMVSEINKMDYKCGAYIGIFNEGEIRPKYIGKNNENNDQYLFEYKNGFKSGTNCNEGRSLNITFVCS
eukprot:297093_1